MANVTVINTGNLASLRTYNIGDDWEIFAERLEQYLKANKVEEERKVSVLITSISEEAYKTLKNLCDPVKPYEKSYADIVKLLDNQFKTKISIFRRRVTFDLLRQGAESINEWFVKVKKVAADCEFGMSLTERVKDKFVVGLKPGRVLDRLCEEKPSRELQELLDIAKEAAIKESREVEVNKLNSFRGVKKTNPGTSSSKKDVKVREDGQNKTHQEKQVRCYHCSKVHMATGVTPSSLIFKHKIRTRLDFLTEPKNLSSENNVKNYKGKRDEVFKEGDKVLCRDYRNSNKKKWVEATIDEVLGDRVYLCKTVNDSLIWKMHLNQIVKDRGDLDINEDYACGTQYQNQIPSTLLGNSRANDFNTISSNHSSAGSSGSGLVDNTNRVSSTSASVNSNIPVTSLNVNERPRRVIKPPDRLNL
ncbi:hypothetical protein NQ315_008913 [Exocentrus adspersus]|uniref:Uncharacterized protein n=1 Tax=Exocentrus adspersus TaxID=1586481 RepID=A0AAV8V7G6_9CUCU|nr:hypothetical protein NQ315_008913 [Exocentrus adspersus]